MSFYDAQIKNNFFPKIQKLKQIFKIHVWTWEFLKFVINYYFANGLSKHDNFRRWLDVKRDIKFIKKNGLDKKIILMGVNKFSEFYIKEIKDKIAFIIDKNHIGENINGIEVIDCNELLSLNPNDYYYYLFDRLTLRKQQGDLIELGVSDSLIFWGGRTRTGWGAGGDLQDSFDPILGYTSDKSGFIIFSNSDDENAFKIVTLGGSTSDPRLENLKSWSEYLFDKLSNMGIKVKIYVGGLSSYTVAQECLKLIKDVLVISPDLVISYSGVNDMTGSTNIENHYFNRDYYHAILNKMISKGYIKNVLQGKYQIKQINLGLHDSLDQCDFWIKCERIMHSVCYEFGIDFHGCLQGFLFKVFDNLEKLDEYKKCKKYIADNNFAWLHDMTEIFNGNEDVFYDLCHVFEKGNRIIAQNMMPFVLESYNKRKGKL